MAEFPNHCHIPSARVGWHDYNSGACFYTLCAASMQYCFGKISNRHTHFSICAKTTINNKITI